ncbi:MAG TPA: glycoside hydrolase family 43 protein [Chitinophagaceae bacterium]|nr:glycoside hydrolase family 43 protein [Chitinophagaceae bacterium]
MNNSKSLIILYFLLTSMPFYSHAQKTATGDVYLFSYFKGNGDGLHFAYSMDGLKWEALKGDSIFLRPAVGKDKLMRDPCIIKGPDGKYHMVWTVSWSEKGIGYASSTDLIHWSEQQYIPVMEHEQDALNAWAPEITYDDRNQNYLIYWATTITNRFTQKDTSAEGKRYNHRMYATTTKDFKTYSPTTLFYEPGFSVIDASIVKAGKKEYVMFLKNETRAPVEKNIRIARSKKLTKSFGAPSEPITGKYWAEGPAAVKIGNQWIVYFDKYTEHAYGAVSSTDLKNWTDISDRVTFPKGIRHGTVFTITRGEFDRIK